MAQDDDLVEETRTVPVGAYRPRVTEFGTTEELLAGIHDLIGHLNTNFIVANGAKSRPHPPKPFPRPETARDRARKRWAATDVLDIVSAVTPHAAERVRRSLGIAPDDE
ncbi:MAG TPA: hypothetical protein VK735_39640 [Pseudonocardia sp.]|uniref:hypothetical protein n=1 Tax=Pseudonocardia sp. TaxID=60912 RepID=UPI002B832A8A|nr:hypothetical protein [Pseudonocardia sp.]HTF53596.1 hypothetical protein [Pseudonocardia sp.]